MVKGIALFPGKGQSEREYSVKILVYQLALVYRYYGHEIAFFVHAQRHLAVLDEDAERILNLLSVAVRTGAAFNFI